MNPWWRRICQGCWNWFWHPPGLHARRWRAVATWVVAFSLIVAYALETQRRESNRNDKRFCDITESFITSELVLRDALNEASLQSVGERMALIAETNRIIRYLQRPQMPARSPASQRFTNALIDYLRTNNALNRRLNESSVATLDAADEASQEWERLQRRLRC